MTISVSGASGSFFCKNFSLVSLLSYNASVFLPPVAFCHNGQSFFFCNSTVALLSSMRRDNGTASSDMMRLVARMDSPDVYIPPEKRLEYDKLANTVGRAS